MTDECTVRIMAGVCKKNTTIHATMNEDMTVSVDIQSDCPMVTKSPIGPIVPWEEVGVPMNQSKVYEWASNNIGHTACPVPCGIVKAIEAAGGLGLKKSPVIEIE